ncbi:MAG: hypothetical protein JTT11_03995, partial [Candidatus Brockarchaeota archaeon]|nr:hypothetical protein [Candidatus Brockarchaeota archaeon]
MDKAKRPTVSNKPEWLGSREGISDEVLPPWVPIEVKRKCSKEEPHTFSVSCWGRIYEFAASPFPVNVVTKNRTILADSIRMTARVDGRLQRWQGGSIELNEATDARACFSQRISSSTLRLSSEIKIEYDGLVRIDWRLEPLRPLRLEELTFEIPLDSKCAKYFYYFP